MWQETQGIEAGTQFKNDSTSVWPLDIEMLHRGGRFRAEAESSSHECLAWPML